MSKRVFVTGVAGLLGSWWAERLVQAGWDVSGCDSLLGGSKENVPIGVPWTVRDCADLEVRVDLKNVNVLVHCAALPHEGLSVFSPALIFDSVASRSVALFSAAIQAGVHRVIYCSSMARYGKGDQGWGKPFQEWQTPAPLDPYGIAKVAAEDVLRALAKVHGFEWVIVVPHNIYGPRQRYWDPTRNVVGIFLNAMLRGEAPRIYGDGLQQRCFSYVGDVAEVLVPICTQPDLVGEVINVGPDEEPVTIASLWDLCAEVTGFSGRPVSLPSRPLEVREANCSADKARRILGWRTKTHLRDGLRQYAQWIRERGPRPFEYHLPIEIASNLAPASWRERWGA